eukprot:2750382-Rhodomonas_salina.1
MLPHDRIHSRRYYLVFGSSLAPVSTGQRIAPERTSVPPEMRRTIGDVTSGFIGSHARTTLESRLSLNPSAIWSRPPPRSVTSRPGRYQLDHVSSIILGHVSSIILGHVS